MQLRHVRPRSYEDQSAHLSSSITPTVMDEEATAASLVQPPLGNAETGDCARRHSPGQRLMLCLSHLQGQPGPAGPQGPPGADGAKASVPTKRDLITPKGATAINRI